MSFPAFADNHADAIRRRGMCMPLKRWLAALAATLLLTLALAQTPPLPERLSQTGLYVAGSTRTVQADVLAYAPQYPLWSDGATKRRWIQLPPGATIDASAVDAWNFPPGTRLWKEFAHGRPIETRMIERLPDGRWRFASYIWNPDGKDATLAPAQGVRRLPAPDAPGASYTIPSRTDCLSCHDTDTTPVLGFSALQLSPARDRGAAHAEALPAEHVDLQVLQARKLLVNVPTQWQQSPPRIAGRDATERAALGYLHANCGHCHNDNGPLAALDMNLRQRVGDAQASAQRSLSTLLDRDSGFQPDPLRQDVRLRAADPQHSTLLQRIGANDAMRRMPPIGVSVPDVAGMALLRRWITQTLSTHLEKPP